MITMYSIHPWADQQLQIERHSASPDRGHKYVVNGMKGVKNKNNFSLRVGIGYQ